MAIWKRLTRLTALLLSALLCLLLVLTLLAPRLIDQRAIKEKITSELSRLLNARVQLESLHISFVGFPKLSVKNPGFVFPDGTTLTVTRVELSPSLWRLLRGRIELAHIELEEPVLAVRIPLAQPKAPPSPSPEDIQQQIAGYVQSALQSAPSCSLEVSNGTLRLQAPDGSLHSITSIDAEAWTSADSLNLWLDCASAIWKQLSVKAQCRPAAPGRPPVSLELTGRMIDLRSLKAALGSLAGDNSTLSSIAGSIGGGSITDLSLTAQLPPPSPAAEPLLGITGRADVDNMSIAVPGFAIKAHNMNGELSAGGGMVRCDSLSARIGGSILSNGAIMLDSTKGFTPTLIRTGFAIDLSDLPGLLHLIPEPSMRSELERIQNPRGTARGTFELQREGDGFPVAVAIDELLLRADYRAFPPELELKRGTCAYRNGVLAFSDFSGRLGSSKLPGFALSLALDNATAFSAGAEQASVQLDDLRRVLESFEGSRSLVSAVTGAAGLVRIGSLRLSGPLGEPARWDVALQGSVADAALTLTGLDGPVEIRTGRLRADSAVCSLAQADIAHRDAALQGSLTLRHYLSGIPGIAVEAGGMLGPQALALAARSLNLPPGLTLRAPVAITSSRTAWNGKGPTEFAGDFVLGRETSLGIHITADRNAVEINRLHIRDTASRCAMGIRIEEDLIRIVYEGTLKKETLDRALDHNPFLQGWISGDFTATLNQKSPARSSARGRLAWENAGLPGLSHMPVTIPAASVSAQGNRLKIESARMTAEQEAASIQGSVEFAEGGFGLDLAVSAGVIDADALAALAPPDNATDNESGSEFWETPLRGTVKLTIGKLKKGAMALAPLNAKIGFADRAVTVTTDGTKFCDIDLPGTVRIAPDAVTAEIRPSADGRPMENVLRCITGEKAVMTGTVDIRGIVTASGRPEDLPESLAGNISIQARDGRIYKSGLFTKLLSFLSIRQLLTGGFLDMMEKGYAYEVLRIKSDLKGRTMQIREGVLVSSALTLVCQGTADLQKKEIDLEALVTPFQIQETVLSKIPVAGDLFKKTVVGVPLSIRGPMETPEVSTRTISTLSKGVTGLARDIIKLPLQLIEPVLPKNSSTSK